MVGSGFISSQVTCIKKFMILFILFYLFIYLFWLPRLGYAFALTGSE